MHEWPTKDNDHNPRGKKVLQATLDLEDERTEDSKGAMTKERYRYFLTLNGIHMYSFQLFQRFSWLVLLEKDHHISPKRVWRHQWSQVRATPMI